MVKRRPFLTGQCEHAGLHDLCRGVVAGLTCTCDCHAPEPEPVETITVPTVPMVPGSDAWMRRVTASKVAAIIGVANPRWSSARALWHEMRGDVPRDAAPNKDQSRGHYLEAGILAWWRDRHPEYDTIEEQPQYLLGDWAAATPDQAAYVQGANEYHLAAIVEAKSDRKGDEWGEEGTDQIPASYLTQVHWQLHLSGAPRCHVPMLGAFLDFREYVVEADPEVGALLEAKARAFYASLAGDEPPPLDDSPATYAVMRRLHPQITPQQVAHLSPADAREYVEASLDFKRAEARERLAKAQVLEVMGTAQYAECGVRVARRQPNKSGVSLVRVCKDPSAVTEPEGDAA